MTMVAKSEQDNLWHHWSVSEVIKQLKSSQTGLTSAQAKELLESQGRNVLPRQRSQSALLVFWR